ncbi:MAG TPA: c-type cytochrome [Bryobacteraceae bacterium]|nr:c-type cytochrome [Bryobacteraceae bacterium]
MSIRLFGSIGLLILALAGVGVRWSAEAEQAPLRPTPAGAGAEMYLDYCAPCHGRDGTGSGPVSPALKVRTTDLTTLAKRNNGVYPAERVRATISGDLLVVAHGSKDMPVWGPAFRYLGGGSRAEVTVRVDSLTRYIQSLQVAPVRND